MLVPCGLGPPLRVVAAAPGKSTLVYVGPAEAAVANPTLTVASANDLDIVITGLTSQISLAVADENAE